MDTNSYLLVAIAVFTLLSAMRRGSAALEPRLRRLERKLDAIVENLGITINQNVDPAVLELLRTGHKIDAIKLYRQQTGVGLKEAKEFVESL